MDGEGWIAGQKQLLVSGIYRHLAVLRGRSLPVISDITVFALRSLHAANLTPREEPMASEARLLVDQLRTFHRTLLESTPRFGGLFEKRFNTG